MLCPASSGRSPEKNQGIQVISTIEKVLFLKGVDLFHNIPGEDLSHIAQITDEVEFNAHEVVVKEGDQGDAMYLIADGKVKVHAGDKILAELSKPQCFGEMSILDEEPRSASVTALSELLLLRILRDDFAEILAERPEISQGIIKVLTRRLRNANRR